TGGRLQHDAERRPLDEAKRLAVLLEGGVQLERNRRPQAGAAETDLGEPLAPVERDEQQQMRARRRRAAQVYACEQRPCREAESRERGLEQTVELEAIAAASAGNELRKDFRRVERDASAEQDVEILEGNRVGLGAMDALEAVGRYARRGSKPDTVEIGIGGKRCVHYRRSCARTASPKAFVASQPAVAGPAMSRVRAPLRNAATTAFSTVAAAASAPRLCRSSIAALKIVPQGFARPWPAISGAQPGIGSSRPGPASPSDADGSSPIEPASIDASSVRMSPNMFSVTMTSKSAGRLKRCMAAASTSRCSTVSSGNSSRNTRVAT